MRRSLGIALGIATSVGGFLEGGSLTTSARAGAAFGYRHIWAIALGAVCLAWLVEMSGRLSAVSGVTIAAAVRRRFGATFFTTTMAPLAVVTVLVLASEIGGVCVALELATGVAFPWWALPVGVVVWLTLWRGPFGVMEAAISLLGLVTAAFLVASLRLHADWPGLGRGLLPSGPASDAGRYWSAAVAIIGALLTPYLVHFAAPGGIEHGWDTRRVALRRRVAMTGIGAGAVLALSVLVVAALVLQPRGIEIARYEQVALTLVAPFGLWGFWLFVASLAIACFGAALEIALALAYTTAQGLGWRSGKNLRPREAARLTLLYTAAVALGVVPMVLGIDPLKLTVVAMVLTAACLPLAVLPFLVVMNDAHYVGAYGNRWISNAVVGGIVVLAAVLALVSLPLAGS